MKMAQRLVAALLCFHLRCASASSSASSLSGQRESPECSAKAALKQPPVRVFPVEGRSQSTRSSSTLGALPGGSIPDQAVVLQGPQPSQRLVAAAASMGGSDTPTKEVHIYEIDDIISKATSFSPGTVLTDLEQSGDLTRLVKLQDGRIAFGWGDRVEIFDPSEFIAGRNSSMVLRTGGGKVQKLAQLQSGLLAVCTKHYVSKYPPNPRILEPEIRLDLFDLSVPDRSVHDLRTEYFDITALLAVPPDRLVIAGSIGELTASALSMTAFTISADLAIHPIAGEVRLPGPVDCLYYIHGLILAVASDWQPSLHVFPHGIDFLDFWDLAAAVAIPLEPFIGGIVQLGHQRIAIATGKHIRVFHVPELLAKKQPWLDIDVFVGEEKLPEPFQTEIEAQTPKLITALVRIGDDGLAVGTTYGTIHVYHGLNSSVSMSSSLILRTSKQVGGNTMCPLIVTNQGELIAGGSQLHSVFVFPPEALQPGAKPYDKWKLRTSEWLRGLSLLPGGALAVRTCSNKVELFEFSAIAAASPNPSRVLQTSLGFADVIVALSDDRLAVGMTGGAVEVFDLHVLNGANPLVATQILQRPGWVTAILALQHGGMIVGRSLFTGKNDNGSNCDGVLSLWEMDGPAAGAVDVFLASTTGNDLTLAKTLHFPSSVVAMVATLGGKWAVGYGNYQNIVVEVFNGWCGDDPSLVQLTPALPFTGRRDEIFDRGYTPPEVLLLSTEDGGLAVSVGQDVHIFEGIDALAAPAPPIVATAVLHAFTDARSLVTLNKDVLLVGGSIFVATACPSGSASPQGEMLCTLCVEGWLSTPGAAYCEFASDARVCFAFLGTLAAVVAAAVLSKGVSAIRCRLRRRECSSPMVSNTVGAILCLLLAAGAPVYALTTPLCVVCLVGMGSSIAMLFADSMQALGALILFMLPACLSIMAMMIGVPLNQRQWTPLGTRSTVEAWQLLAAIAGLVVLIVAAATQQCISMQVGGDVEVMHRTSLAFFGTLTSPNTSGGRALWHSLRRAKGVASSWGGQHIAAAALACFTLVQFGWQLASQQADDARRCVTIMVCVMASVETIVHTFALCAAVLRERVACLLPYADRHFRLTVILKHAVFYLKLESLRMPFAQVLDGTPEWTCRVPSFCPDECTIGLHGECSTDSQGRCLCIGWTTAKLLTIVNCLLTIGFTFCLTGKNVKDLLHQQEFMTQAQRPRLTLLAMVSLRVLIAVLKIMILFMLSRPERVSSVGDLDTVAIVLTSMFFAMLANELKRVTKTWIPSKAVDHSTLRTESGVRLFRLIASIAGCGGMMCTSFSRLAAALQCLGAFSALLVGKGLVAPVSPVDAAGMLELAEKKAVAA